MSEQVRIRITRKKLRRKLPTYSYAFQAVNSEGFPEFGSAAPLNPISEWYEATFNSEEYEDLLPLLLRRRTEAIAVTPRGKPAAIALEDFYEWSVRAEGKVGEDMALQFMLRWDHEKAGF